MWTAIWSRARTTLTVLAVLLTMVLVVAVIFLALQWAEPDQTYTYQSYDLEVTPLCAMAPGPVSEPGVGAQLQRNDCAQAEWFQSALLGAALLGHMPVLTLRPLRHVRWRANQRGRADDRRHNARG